MEKKEKQVGEYESPEIGVYRFDNEDILTVSVDRTNVGKLSEISWDSLTIG